MRLLYFFIRHPHMFWDFWQCQISDESLKGHWLCELSALSIRRQEVWCKIKLHLHFFSNFFYHVRYLKVNVICLLRTINMDMFHVINTFTCLLCILNMYMFHVINTFTCLLCILNMDMFHVINTFTCLPTFYTKYKHKVKFTWLFILVKLTTLQCHVILSHLHVYKKVI